MSYVLECIGVGASYYNLAIAVAVFILFIRLFKNAKKTYILPWKLLFAAFCTYIVEEIITIISSLGLISVSVILFPILEMIIICLFIYACLVQKNHMGQGK